MARTQRDKRRPLIAEAEDPRKVLEELAQERDPLYEEIADITVQTDEQSAKFVVNDIIEQLESINGLG